MTGPLYMMDAFGYTAYLASAVVIGFLFGFVLERAGFGDARNIVNLFYFRDMRVLRVFFAAIVTALLGLLVLWWVGLFDYSMLLQHTLLKTYVLPHLVGGLIFGIGFVMGGYCPGTSAVALMSGKLDSLVFIIGMIVGIWVFAFGWSLWGSFYQSTPLGRITLWQFFGIPIWLMALIIVVMAFGAFIMAKFLERWAPYDR